MENEKTNVAVDMTTGNPIKRILLFSIPVAISNVFQQMYTVADSVIVSRGVGVQALAALGATEWMIFLMTGSVVSLSEGFGVLISQKFGQKDRSGVKKAVAMSIGVAIITTLVMTFFLEGMLRRALDWLNVSKDIYGDAYYYSRIIFAGTVVYVFYNVAAAILRSLGDSRNPLIAVVISSAINVILDVVFVYVIKGGVKGAAIATLMAQTCAGIYCMAVLKKQDFILPQKNEWKPDVSLIVTILRLTSPLFFSNVIISISGMIVQSVVNSCGTEFLVGFTAVNKLYYTFNLISVSLAYAIATFVGQNYGAGQYQRIKEGVNKTLLLAILSSVVIAIVFFIFDEQIVGIFISEETDHATAVIEGAVQYLHQFALWLWALYAAMIFQYALQAVGWVQVNWICGFAGFLTRTMVALFLPAHFGTTVLYYDEVSAWILYFLISVTFYVAWLKRV